jgi:hypothetical protein
MRAAYSSSMLIPAATFATLADTFVSARTSLLGRGVRLQARRELADVRRGRA